MSQFIDRRPNSKNKSAVNRQRFLQRFKNQIKKSVQDAIDKRSITDVERGEKVIIPAKDTYEPRLYHGKGGRWEVVHTGNKDYSSGDHIKRESSEGGGIESHASNKGSGWDEFVFELTKEEFIELFFDDLALPNMIKTQINRMPNVKQLRAGFSRQGTPSNLSVIRSMRAAHARRIALSSSVQQQLKEANAELEDYSKKGLAESPPAIQLQAEIERLRKKILRIPFIDPYDLRYHSRVKRSLPSTQAVMFCIMDVSGSMDEAKKEVAKRFFIMLYLFLTRNYEKIDLVFIRHHTIAKEVDEQEFFYSRETGGTVVSSALELMRDIIQARYPSSEWNIYAAQASDGDNWSADSPYCQELLVKDILPITQYYAYVEIIPRYHQSLWEAYLPVKDRSPNFAMETINDLSDVYLVFKDLFKREPA